MRLQSQYTLRRKLETERQTDRDRERERGVGEIVARKGCRTVKRREERGAIEMVLRSLDSRTERVVGGLVQPRDRG